MTFIPQPRIEATADRLWHSHQLQPNFDAEQLAELMGLSILWEEVEDDPRHPTFGVLVPDDRLIILNQSRVGALEARGGRLRRYTVGHEIGHWELHAAPMPSGNLTLFYNGRMWCRDGSFDPVERQAEMFSARLLMPRTEMLKAPPTEPWCGWRTVYQLADQFGVNATPMIIRLEELDLAHRDENGQPCSGPRRAAGQERLF